MKIDLFHVGIATCILSINNQVKIAIDPALFKKGTKLKFKSFESERLENPNFDSDTFEDIDIWLISHFHEDHIDILGKEKISQDSLVLSNKDSLTFLADKNVKKIGWKEKHVFSKDNITVEIQAIPAYHANSFLMRKLVGKVNGYLLTVTIDSVVQKIYFTSDTVFHKDIIKALPQSIDILIANLGNVQANKTGGPLTMNISMLDKFVDILSPSVIVPVHINDLSHYETQEVSVTEAGYKVLETGKWHTLLNQYPI
ncbi:MBL fold metallo-hydrolase [Candidatus Enterococcus ikei]|uniref:MBL fold metallo-hydrolase n=1 Tax=Candidatus Enterococcus ikei TaxID=2815326 RepID=A0ABS3H1Q0_9ENTE|nr:MBL fold metallo-hydrolase [Enterococcus sp. DIV0869a]MBO0441450.1 MBL fold metallo-hydrolase [Enterococcus sp. DIV0869a]